MKLHDRTLLPLLLCALIPFLALADKNRDDDDEQDEKNVVYGLTLPAERPKSATMTLEDGKDRYKKLFELREKVLDCFTDLEDIAKIEDPQKMKKKAERALQKLERAKKSFFKEARKIRGKLDKQFKPLSTKKQRLEKEIERAEDKGDDKKATKCAQEIARFGSKYEYLEGAINDINYYCFFEQDQLLAQALDMEIPGYGKAREALDDDKDKKKDKKKLDDDEDDDKDKKKKKKKKKQLDDDDDDDDKDKDKDSDRDRKKKKKRRKSRR